MQTPARRIRGALSPHNIGWSLPALLAVIFVAALAVGILGLPEIRGAGYLGLLISLPFGIWALIRQMREVARARGQWPTYFQVVLFWQKVALFVLIVGAGVSFTDSYIPATPDLPSPVYAAMILTGAVAITVTDLSLYFGGKAHVLSAKSRPGPLRLFVRDPEE